MNKTKNIIFRSAITVFSKNGYEGATMDEIAANAGVAKGTLYYHFKSKEEIFKYIITEGMEFMKDQVSIAVENEEEPISRLKALCEVQLNLFYNNKDFFKVVMSQIWGQENRQILLRDMMDGYISYVEKFLKEAMNGNVIKHTNITFMAYNFFGTICSMAMYEIINEGKDDVNELIDTLTQYMLRGIIL